MMLILKRPRDIDTPSVLKQLTCCRKKIKVVERKEKEQPWLQRLRENLINPHESSLSVLESDIRQRMKDGSSPGKLMKIVKEVI
jgi:hypothetical protein